ncbi:MAG: penicillin-binding protein activator [Lysobacteraceae bacterium]
MKRILSQLLIPFLIGCFLAGCAGMGGVTEIPPEVRAADQMLAGGHAREAAQSYAAQAADARGAMHDLLEVRAADAWQQAGDSVQARRAFDAINPKQLDNEDMLRFRLLRAEFAIADGHAAQAAGDLNVADAAIPPLLQVRWYRAHAIAFEANGDKFDAAAQLALLEQLQGRRDANATRVQIHKLLSALDNDTLARGSAALPPGHPLYADAGRMLTARGLPLPHPYARGTLLPVDNARPPADADGYRPPLKLALLLPASGSVAAAGSAVRDGFMAAYYAETRRRPELHFYDSSNSEGGAIEAYKKAVADGNDFVVGPLGRDQVAALFRQSELSVPLIALNRAAEPAPPGSVSFSLAPEDEGVAIAERLLRKGLRRTIAFTARDENASRALAAFREAYTQRGGSIVAEAVVSDNGPDYGPALKDALARSGGQYDAIFLALKAPAARLLAAQLPSNDYRQVPRVATSLILSGGGNARLDQELDGIEYPELAWLLHSVDGLPDASTLGAKLPSVRGGGARLFAFGADAFRLSGYLESLATNPAASVRGATGELRLDGLGNVQRSPEWAVFSGGRARSVQDGALQTEPVRGGL